MRTDFYPSNKSGKQLLIEGYNQSRLLNELAKNGVTLYEVQRLSARQLKVKITSSDLKKTFAILEKLCYNYSVVKLLGLKTAVLSRLTRLGLIVSLAAAIALYALSYGFIWRIEIDGNSKIDTVAIRNSLARQNVSAGVSKKNIDVKQLESQLRKMDGIAEASCEMRGTTLKISVMENLDYVPRPQGETADIVSLYDAEVTRYTVRSGTAKVKVGQRVAKGATLISGEILGTEGQVISQVRADGEVYGKVVFKESVTVAKSGITLTATGKVKNTTVLSLWGWNIGKPYDGFELSRSVAVSHKTALLPVTVTSIRTEEMTALSYELSDEQVREQAEAMLRNRLNEQLLAQPLQEELIFKDMGGGIVQAHLYVTLELKIGEL